MGNGRTHRGADAPTAPPRRVPAGRRQCVRCEAQRAPRVRWHAGARGRSASDGDAVGGRARSRPRA